MRTPLFTILCLALVASPVLAGSPPSFLFKWGGPGTGPGQFDSVDDIAADSGGVLFLTDRNNHRVQRFGSDGTFLGQWGGFGTGDGEFNSPRGIAVGGNGLVYVADQDNSRIQVFQSNGEFVDKWDTFGNGPGEFLAPRAVAVDANGFVYVSEDWFSLKRVQKFTADGVYVTQWGSLGTGDGQFQAPRGLAADNNGNIYVSDTLSDRVQKFSDTGAFLGKWGQNGSGNGQFSFPIGLSWGNGCLYAVDSGNHRVQAFDANGTFQFSFGSQCVLSGGTGCVDPDGGGPLELGDGQFNAPTGVAAARGDRVLVTDTGNNRIQAFGSGVQTGIGTGSVLYPGVRAFPNPTGSSATLGFRLAGAAEGGREAYGVHAEVFDVSGRLVDVLFEGQLPSGDHELRWDGTTRSGGPATPGVFYARILVSGEPTPRTAKILLLP